MNERIKQLAKDAGLYAFVSEDTIDPDIKKFAELIIKECANACLAATKEESSVHLVSVAYAGAVKKHFGVE